MVEIFFVKCLDSVSEKQLLRKEEGSSKSNNLKSNISLKNQSKKQMNEIPTNNISDDSEETNEKQDFSAESDNEEDVRELEGRTVTAKGQEIDRASAGNVKRTKEEVEADPEEEDEFGYTTNKVRKKYATFGQTVVLVQLERSPQGLGLSLAGHKDRNCMAVFVCGLNPSGAAYRTGTIQVGDEILEVNGVVLHGRCHLNASAIIKGLSGPFFKLVILRRKTALEDIAVKPITQFPVTLEEESPESKYSNYPNVRSVSIKKGTHSLGIMIIEGKHSEVGQGIFISDIQEGSAAEKAGLEIGEMILAVNKDLILGSSYDIATNLLKHAEGLVTLTISNPSKKTTTPQAEKITPATISNDSKVVESKAPTPVPEPPPDPATCAIVPGKEMTIELNTNNECLGIFFVGGTDNQFNKSVAIVEIYKNGRVAKDGRLQPGDQILEVNGISLKDVPYTGASQILRQLFPKVKLIVFRPESIQYTPIEVDLIKKPGKGLGLSIAGREDNKGIYVTDILSGGVADIDRKIARGDLVVSINGESIENCTIEQAGISLKTVMGRVILKLNRYKSIT